MNNVIRNIVLNYETEEVAYKLKVGEKDRNFSFQYDEKDGIVLLNISPISYSVKCTSFSLKIHFFDLIFKWRNHNYQWVSLTKNRIANEYSPKILQLSNGLFIQAGNTLGCWEVEKNTKNTLNWHFHTPGLCPVFYFNPERSFYQPTILVSDVISFKLLFTKKSPVEWSRSLIPFSAILCLTDHCDFDSLQLLKRQREILKECNVRISKGIFLNHYSKRNWNIAYDISEGKKEMHQWMNEGHELLFHSLSQSIKMGQAAWDDFHSLKVPPELEDIKVWVDHGYQPYNFTMQKGETEQKFWLKVAESKGFKIFWNYYDSCEETISLNQIGVEELCPSKVWKSKTASWQEKLRLLLYYYSSDKSVFEYRKWSGFIKAFKLKPDTKTFGRLIKSTLPIFSVFRREFLNWTLRANRNHIFVRFAPLVFKYPGMTDINIFQTVAIKNFEIAFSKSSLDEFIEQSGVCIAHTYLASQENHHHGRLFMNEKGDVKCKMIEAWSLLGSQIELKKIWNPVLSELIDWMDKFTTIDFTMNEIGEIVYSGPHDIPIRTINE